MPTLEIQVAGDAADAAFPRLSRPVRQSRAQTTFVTYL